MNQNINEAFVSPLIQKIYNIPMAKDVFEAIQRVYPDIALNRIPEKYFKLLSATDALKINKDVIKFWMDGSIALTTRSNSFFDRFLETRKSKRGNLIGCDKYHLLKCLEEGNKYLGTLHMCYVLDLQQLLESRDASIAKIEFDRKEQKSGAVALMTSKEIKEGNIARYIATLKDKKFSDGSEFNLISNINNLLTKKIAATGSLSFLVNCIGNSSMLNYFNAYTSVLIQYIELLNKNGFILPSNGKILSKYFITTEYEKSDIDRLTTIRSLLKSKAEEISSSTQMNVSNKYDVKINNTVKAIINNPKNVEKLKSVMCDVTHKNFLTEKTFDTFIQTIIQIETVFPRAISNKNISSDIMNFDLFLAQLSGIAQQLSDNMNQLNDFITDVAYILEMSNADFSDYRLSSTLRSANSAAIGRVISYINMIAKI